ncbi:hypothetical protein [Yersinia enterocolitica]|nr:DUF2513 domain-containing protein [Yersinia enterocolitica]
MKINHEYLKDLLIAFENTDGPDTILSDLTASGFSKESNEFIFHMRLLYDNGMIIRIDSHPGFGHQLNQHLGGYDYYWITVRRYFRDSFV